MRRLLALILAVTLLSATASAQIAVGSQLVIDEPTATSSNLNYTIHAPGVERGTVVRLYMSFNSGQCSATQMGMSFTLPLDNSALPIATTRVKNGRASGHVNVPALPLGVTPSDLWFAGVVLDLHKSAMVTAAIPFGPIIEDAIQ